MTREHDIINELLANVNYNINDIRAYFFPGKTKNRQIETITSDQPRTDLASEELFKLIQQYPVPNTTNSGQSRQIETLPSGQPTADFLSNLPNETLIHIGKYLFLKRFLTLISLSSIHQEYRLQILRNIFIQYKAPNLLWSENLDLKRLAFNLTHSSIYITNLPVAPLLSIKETSRKKSEILCNLIKNRPKYLELRLELQINEDSFKLEDGGLFLLAQILKDETRVKQLEDYKKTLLSLITEITFFGIALNQTSKPLINNVLNFFGEQLKKLTWHDNAPPYIKLICSNYDGKIVVQGSKKLQSNPPLVDDKKLVTRFQHLRGLCDS